MLKKIIGQWEREAGIQLAEAQKEAIHASLKYGVFVLTGGPGTGKTTVVKGIITVLEKAGCRILLAAPTGRAAKRLAESSGHPAQTVHRLLEYQRTAAVLTLVKTTATRSTRKQLLSTKPPCLILP